MVRGKTSENRSQGTKRKRFEDELNDKMDKNTGEKKRLRSVVKKVVSPVPTKSKQTSNDRSDQKVTVKNKKDCQRKESGQLAINNNMQVCDKEVIKGKKPELLEKDVLITVGVDDAEFLDNEPSNEPENFTDEEELDYDSSDLPDRDENQMHEKATEGHEFDFSDIDSEVQIRRRPDSDSDKKEEASGMVMILQTDFEAYVNKVVDSRREQKE